MTTSVPAVAAAPTSNTPPAGTAATAATESATVGLVPGRGVGAVSVAIFVLGLAVAANLPSPSGATFRSVEGVGVFAVFYLVAQVAERGVELITPFFRFNLRLKKRGTAGAELGQVIVNRRAVTFALACALGMVLCGYLGADFLTAVGFVFASPTTGSAVLQLAVTGLVVGGGSDGLHGLISNLTKSSAKKGEVDGGQAA
jgi:hypothetical protein